MVAMVVASTRRRRSSGAGRGSALPLHAMRVLAVAGALPRVASESECPAGSIASTTGVAACCPARCGRCGGKDCDQLADGPQSCCAAYIQKVGRTCNGTNPPCIPGQHGGAVRKTFMAFQNASVADNAVPRVNGRQNGMIEHGAKPALRLVFLHVPKTGTSFVNCLLQYGCSYNGSVGLAYLRDHRNSVQAHEQCRGSFMNDEIQHAHPPLQPNQITAGVGIVGMFRSPKERLLSGFMHNFHDCKFLPSVFDVRCNSDYLCPTHVNVRHNLSAAVRLYSKCVQGCAVRMLAGQVCGRTLAHIDQGTSRYDLRLAMDRIRQSFTFLGDTGQWNRSVCIFCALFPPRYQEYNYDLLFDNVRPSPTSSLDENVRKLIAEQPYDTADEAVYDVAAAWLDYIEPTVQFNERYLKCRAAWLKSPREHPQSR